MLLIARDDLRDVFALARAAITLHDRTTHYGKCDVCDVVDAWRRRLDDHELNVDGRRPTPPRGRGPAP